jgi:hypothetical protein
MTGTTLLLSLDLAGTFAFALNGAITGARPPSWTSSGCWHWAW